MVSEIVPVLRITLNLTRAGVRRSV